MMHICDQCYQPANEHDEECPCGCGAFLMPLCCPGCGCRSFEDAHGGVNVMVDERMKKIIPVLSTRLLRIQTSKGKRK